jgi:hypothetical protein
MYEVNEVKVIIANEPFSKTYPKGKQNVQTGSVAGESS